MVVCHAKCLDSNHLNRGKGEGRFAGHKRGHNDTWSIAWASRRIALTDRKLTHIAESMIGVSVARDGFHELIAEQDDDTVTLVLHHHRR